LPARSRGGLAWPYRVLVETKLTIVVRADLGMGRGKIAAQASHAAVAATLASFGSSDFRAWLSDGQPKVVLRADSEEDLASIAERATAAGLPVQLIRDAGRTQVPSGTPTCCAIGPAEASMIDAVTGDLSLL
jgi:peptidyl-tRNA hydrolase, PTH2 family